METILVWIIATFYSVSEFVSFLQDIFTAGLGLGAFCSPFVCGLGVNFGEPFAAFGFLFWLPLSDSIYPIYEEILSSLPALAFDDVYITGVIAEKLNISRINTNYFVRLDWLKLWPKDIDSKLFESNILFIHDFSYRNIVLVWNKFHVY